MGDTQTCARYRCFGSVVVNSFSADSSPVEIGRSTQDRSCAYGNQDKSNVDGSASL